PAGRMAPRRWRRRAPSRHRLLALLFPPGVPTRPPGVPTRLPGVPTGPPGVPTGPTPVLAGTPRSPHERPLPPHPRLAKSRPSRRGATAEPARAPVAAAPTPGEVSAQPPAAVVDQVGQAGDEVTDGDVTVVVRSDGPLRTRLTTKRTAPGQRQNESLTVG